MHYYLKYKLGMAWRILRSMLLFAAVSTPLIVLGNFRVGSWENYYLFLLYATLLMIAVCFVLCDIVVFYRHSGKRIRKIVLIGCSADMVELYNELTGGSLSGFDVCGYFDNGGEKLLPPECRRLGQPDDVVQYLKNHKEIRECYCCLPAVEREEIVSVARYCENHFVHFYSVPEVREYLRHRTYVNMIGDVPYLSLHNEPLASAGNRALKRAFDVVFSLLFLCTLFIPVLLVVAVVSKITMPGPLFFLQKRTGLSGKSFYCIKFRSMKVNASADTLQATEHDPRKTRWGNIMRKTNIDELPQFINVLVGDMSVVGPRPHMVMHTEEYSQLIDKYMLRHWVKPGITGLSQVMGYRGETKELWQMKGRVRNDIWYIEHWSFKLDLCIICKTVTNAVHGDCKAY